MLRLRRKPLDNCEYHDAIDAKVRWDVQAVCIRVITAKLSPESWSAATATLRESVHESAWEGIWNARGGVL